MNAFYPLARLIQWLQEGKPAVYPEPVPDGEQIEQADALFAQGISGRHLKSNLVWQGVLTGVDGTGEDPDLSCAFVGVEVGDEVSAVLLTTTFANSSELFESTVPVDDEIQQLSLTDLSANTYLVTIIRG